MHPARMSLGCIVLECRLTGHAERPVGQRSYAQAGHAAIVLTPQLVKIGAPISELDPERPTGRVAQP